MLVCHYGSLPQNNLLSPHKSSPLKAQAPLPQFFWLRIIFLFRAKQQFKKKLPSPENLEGEREWWCLSRNKEWGKKLFLT